MRSYKKGITETCISGKKGGIDDGYSSFINDIGAK